MRKAMLFLLVFVLLLVGPTAVRYFTTYDLSAPERTAPPVYDPAKIKDVPIPESHEFVDEPEMGQGLALLDKAHQNNFSDEDLAYLDGRLAARGFEMLPFEGGDLSLALRTVNAFIVVAPLSEFSIDEILAVDGFVERGGRLLLVGDPTRFNVSFDEEDIFAAPTIETDPIPLNSLANQFDIVFNGDYLYNTVENEGNFRNIILRKDGFAESDLVNGLDKLAFYSAHSLRVGASGTAVITADDDTWSSSTDRPGGLVLAASSRHGQVLALGDIHFLTQPYFTVFDNGEFTARIADFLTEPAGRDFILNDFPYFFNDPVDLVYAGQPELGPGAFDEIIALQEAFRRVDRELGLTAVPSPDNDALYLGLYNQADDLTEMLATAGITLTIDPPIVADEELDAAAAEADAEAAEDTDAVRLIQSDQGNILMSGTSLILLDEEDGRRRVIVLAASSQGLENSVNRLLNLIPLNAAYALSDCVLFDNLALCPSNVTDEPVEVELQSRDTPEETSEEATPPPPDEGSGGFDEIPEALLNAIWQGDISAGQTVTGTLAEGESHSWSFWEGPTTIDITLSGDEALDGVLELYGPDGALLYTADYGLSGDDEQLSAVDIPDGAVYTIVVRDFYGNPADYTLTVLLSEG